MSLCKPEQTLQIQAFSRKNRLDGFHNVDYNDIMLPRKTRRRQNKIAMYIISFVVIMLVVVVLVKSSELNQKKQDYALREAQLQTAIDKEKERTLEIAEYETYSKTKAYVEDIARDKLGLVYEGEILFRDEN